MLVEHVVEKLESYRPGTFINVAWEKDISSAKARKAGIKVTKSSHGILRTGISYRNLPGVEIVSDKPSWFEHCGKGLIQHKNDNSKKYLQLFTVKGNKVRSKITVNGEVMDPEVAYELGYITKADLPKTEELKVMSVSVENITKFGGK